MMKTSLPAVIMVLCSCSGSPTVTRDPLTVESIENYFFVLDFADGSTMSDVESFFFLTFPHDDPTAGDVVYDRNRWVNTDMMVLEEGVGLSLYIMSRSDGTGYDSFRLTSKPYFNLNEDAEAILFVMKGAVPSARGMWPAWWLNGSHQDAWVYREPGGIGTDDDLDKYSGTGPFYETPSPVNPTDWPAAGEVDIIETINGDNLVRNTVHTCPRMCDSEWNSDGKIINCANAIPGDPNSGCTGESYTTTIPEGTFACLWESQSIRFYYWSPDEDVRRDGAPLSQGPVPELWTANLKNEVRLMKSGFDCDDALHMKWQCASCRNSRACEFSNMKLILNTTLCGTWAGSEFDDTDNALSNCREYILGEGKQIIDGQFMRIEYLSVRGL